MTTWEQTMEVLALGEELDDEEITIEDIIEFKMMEEDDKCTVES